MGKGRKGGQATYLVRPLFAHERGGARCKSVSCALLRPLLDANGQERGGGGREGREEKLGGVLRSLHTQFCTNWVAGNGLGEMGAGGKRKQGSEPEPCSGSKTCASDVAGTCSRSSLPPLPPLLSSASPGPIRVEKGSQEGTADASASRAAPFVRKKRAHEGGARGHAAAPLSPSTPLPLPLWLSPC
ncbi:hypothetical protein EDB85DRAFT_1331460 [Lactarius pseudohatsudake]|nr:hypothetical protein EDB85DRAFT_1331460 [Lactarius pseudohatsudake]